MRNPDLDIYTSDGRINPDKAFELVRDTMKKLTPDEFRRLASMPFKMRGTDNSVVRTFPEQMPAVEPAMPVKSAEAVGSTPKKKSRDATTPRPRTRPVKKAGS